jgi:hypothetical protein
MENPTAVIILVFVILFAVIVLDSLLGSFRVRAEARVSPRPACHG